jgi:hypothetical protein
MIRSDMMEWLHHAELRCISLPAVVCGARRQWLCTEEARSRARAHPSTSASATHGGARYRTRQSTQRRSPRHSRQSTAQARLPALRTRRQRSGGCGAAQRANTTVTLATSPSSLPPPRPPPPRLLPVVDTADSDSVSRSSGGAIAAARGSSAASTKASSCAAYGTHTATTEMQWAVSGRVRGHVSPPPPPLSSSSSSSSWHVRSPPRTDPAPPECARP